MTEMQLKTPPHSLEAEQSVLGGLMQDNRQFDYVAELIRPEDFYRADHQLIFQSMVDQVERSQPVDVVTLVDLLNTKNKLSEVGGLEYLADLSQNALGATNIVAYARIIKDKSTLRKLVRAGNSIADIGYNSEESVTARVSESQRLVMEIGSHADKSALVGVDQLLPDAIAEIDRRSQLKDGLIGLSTGIDRLDEMTGGLGKGQMIVLAGRPSMGKSTFSMNIAEHNLKNGKHCVIFNLEMPRNDVMFRTLSSLSGVPHDQIRKGRINDDQYPAINAASNKIKSWNIQIDDTPGIVSQQIRARLRRASRAKPIDLIVVDYLQIMGDTVKGNDTSRITLISRQLKSLAKEFECPLIALSQLNRGVEERANKRPTMADLRESGAIEQDADVIFFMYRDEVYNEHSPATGLAEVIIGKQRNGPLGTVLVSSQLEYMRFCNYTGQAPVYSKQKPMAELYKGRAA